MIDWFPLPIFPEGALAHSVTTCVWVGVFVIVFFNLRFGWVLSGLVVPGYLAPLLFVKPWAAAVVVGESIVTYGVVYLFSEVMSRLGYWSSLFGRDRFFALVIASVAVRLVFDVMLLPDFAHWLETRWAVTFDFRNNLHSFGLVIICLLANQFWKTGLVRGVVPVVVCIGLTYLIIRFGLMELTNFSVGNLSYIYEDVAASLLASPKSYMILLLTAFLASRMNLRYGWDFNGILIPSLLALQWYQPEKILVSFAEALLVLFVARALLKLPWLGRVNIEGGRKLLLFFNISFVYKMLLGWALLIVAPEVKATDFYGFGYLLPTLIAVKMHDKEIFARLTRATLQTSLTAALFASVAAFALSRVGPLERFDSVDGPAAKDREVVATDASLGALIAGEKVTLYGHRSIDTLSKPIGTELDQFNRALDDLETYRARGDAAARARASASLGAVNFDLVEHRDWFLLRERAPTLGWGIYAIARQPRAALAIEIPAPLEDPHLTEVGVALFESLGAQSLAIAGSSARLDQNRSPIATVDALSIFQAFHRHVSRNDTLQVRGLDATNARALPAGAANAGSVLLVDAELPAALRLVDLERLAGTYDVRWSPTRLDNVQRESRDAGFAELYLDGPTVRRLLYGSVAARRGSTTTHTVATLEGNLAEWLPREGLPFAGRGSDDYRAPTREELLYLDEQVLAPLIHFARSAVAPGNDAVTSELAALDVAAAVLGYRLLSFESRDRADTLVVLAPAAVDNPPYWGTYVFRVGPATAQIVEVPRPLSETGTLEFGVALFDALDARALLIAGAHPAANADGSADVTRLINRASLFNLANQSLVRASGGNEPLHIVQLRAFGERPGLPVARADVLVSQGFSDPRAEDARAALLAQVAELGLTTRAVDGSLETAGYETHLVVQNRYLEQSSATGFTTLWLAQRARNAFREQTSDRQLEAQLTSLGIERQETILAEAMAAQKVGPGLPAALEHLLETYRRSRDVVVLHHVRQAFPRHLLAAIRDPATQQVYLLVKGHDDRVQAVMYLGSALDAGVVRTGDASAPVLSDFVRRRAAWLVFGGAS